MSDKRPGRRQVVPADILDFNSQSQTRDKPRQRKRTARKAEAAERVQAPEPNPPSAGHFSVEEAAQPFRSLAAEHLAPQATDKTAAILEHTTDCYCVLDAEWRFTQLNDRACRYFSASREELIGKVLWELFPQVRGTIFEQKYREAVTAGRPVHFEAKSAIAPGRSSEVHACPLGGSLHIYFRDITARTQAEEELEKDSRCFALLAWTSNQLLLTTDPAETLRRLSQQAMFDLGCEIFLSYLAHQRLHLHSYLGISEEQARAIEYLDYGQGICGTVAEEGHRIVVEHVHQSYDPRAEIIRKWGVGAYACYPLAYRDKIIGTLAFGTTSRETFGPDNLALMESFSGQVAIAMGRRLVEEQLRRMHAREREYAAELENLVQQRTEQLVRANAEIRKRTSALESLTRELTEAEHRERRRMAELLHDGLQQLLVGAQLSARFLHTNATQDQKPEIERLSRTLAEAIQTSRTLTYDLCPPVLLHPGLGSAFVWLAGQMKEKQGLKIELEISEDVEPSSESAKVFLFNAVRELLFNVVKHSGTCEARLELGVSADALQVRVSDAGIGFDPTCIGAEPAKAGFGLFSIQERMPLFEGTMEINSRPGCGSSVILTIPVRDEPCDSL